MTADGDRLAIENLTPAQRTALLARLSKPRARAADPVRGPADLAVEAPLSFAQQRLWFLDRLQGPNPTYNMPLGVRIQGPLDRHALRAAIARLANRHDVLRVRIAEGPDGPRLHAPPSQSFEGMAMLRQVDASGKGRVQALAEAQAFSAADAQQPFNLATGPLFRATLFVLGHDEHHLYLTSHHIISDGWSNTILLRDLLALYLEVRDGVDAGLPPLAAGYLDFARWQRDPARAALIERQTAAWQRRLDEVPQGLEIATDFPRPVALSYRGAVEALTVGQRRTAILREACRLHGASLFMGSLAIFAAVLGRHGAGQDLVIGCPIANRPRPEFEPLLGFFANTIALRIDLGGDPSFAELLTRIRSFMLEAYADQEAPFEQLVERLAGARALDRTPLFEAMLSFQTAPDPSALPERLGLKLEPLERITGRIHFPLTLGVTETADGLEVRLGYHTDLYSAATAARLARHFEGLLDLAARQPDVPLSRLVLLGVEEVAELDRLSGAPAAQQRRAADLRRMVEDQARRSPSTAAVEAIDGTLTYAEFERRANRLARHLCALGVRPGQPIGLCADRRWAMPVGVLASLKAGCPVLMLDPALPARRLATLIEDGKPELILAHRRGLAVLPRSIRTVVLDDIDELTKDQPADAPSGRPLPLAYVLFTSGSTGRPKGVAMGATAFANLVDWQRSHPVLGRKRRTAQFAALGFDVAFQEMFGTWATGGTLVLVDQELRQDPRALWAFLADRRIERLYLPMVALQTLAEAALREPDRRHVLEDVIVAGEALEVTPAVRTFFTSLKQCRLHNHYGPTETHVVTTETLDGTPADWPARPCIGHPVPGTIVRVVGPNGERVPLGVAGELWLGGVQLADGYFGRPDLTAERFVGDAAAGRFYRTGDRVRQRPDGRLDFLGRVDDQVKIRGFRVEPGEVVAALRQLAAVADAAVVAVEGPGGGQVLAAYVVTAQGEANDIAALRAHLAARLPAYCVPSSVTFMDRLPVSANGKIDRRKLPPPDLAGSAREDFVAPQTPTEQRLAAIWAAVFGVEKVSAASDFFDMGGHSLLAVRLALRINEGLRTDLPLRLVFEFPMLRDLAARIDELSMTTVARPPLVEADRSRPLPLSFAQERLYFLQQLYADSSAYNMPAAIRLAGALDDAALERAFSTVVRRHEILRTRFVANRGQVAQIVDPPQPVELPVVDLTGFDEAGRKREIDREIAQLLAMQFDLGTGPLMRLRLLRLAADDALLMVAFHHIVMDEWSIGIFLREIEAIYAGGAEASLPPVKAQHGDFAVWQRSWLDQTAAGPQAVYWQKRLSGAPVSTRLPFDRPRPAQRSGRGGVVPLKVPQPVAEGLGVLAQQHRASAFMALLGGLAGLLFRVSGERDIVVGTPVANRAVPEIENSIGFFVNLVALRLGVDEATSFAALLRQARDVSLGGFANQDLPFERVVELTRPTRRGEATPFVNVVLAYRDSGISGLELPGLTATAWPLGASPVKYDLIVTLVAQEGAYVGAIEYDADLFDRDSVEGLVQGFVALLTAVVASPQTALLDLPIGARRQAAQPEPEFDF
jgi:amino acid adenylation domain-containing protein